MTASSPPENLTSPCCGVTIDCSRGDGVTMGSCSKCGVAVIRANPQTGVQEWLDGLSPWHRGDLRPVVPRAATVLGTTVALGRNKIMTDGTESQKVIKAARAGIPVTIVLDNDSWYAYRTDTMSDDPDGGEPLIIARSSECPDVDLLTALAATLGISTEVA